MGGGRPKIASPPPPPPPAAIMELDEMDEGKKRVSKFGKGRQANILAGQMMTSRNLENEQLKHILG